MKYKTLKMEFKEEKKRFYRTLLIREDLNLIQLGCVLATSIQASFEHYFVFHKGLISYVPESFADGWFDEEHDRLQNQYHFADLGNRFEFEYDTGEGWEFDCTVSEKAEERESIDFAFLLDGAGLGIFEDNIYTLMEYFRGRLKSDELYTDEEKGICPPWNLDMERFSDFDKFDLEEEKDMLEQTPELDYDMYLSRNHEMGYELSVLPYEYGDDWEEDELQKKNVLVSSCLLGLNCRYDGGNCYDEEVARLSEIANLIPICPEQFGGLSTPRDPSEIQGESVFSKQGKDVTVNFKRGAQMALQLAKMMHCKYALLKNGSPSCGSGKIYDGTFSGKLIEGYGVAAQWLEDEGMIVFSEEEIDELIEALKD